MSVGYVSNTMNINLIDSLAGIAKIIDMINPKLNLHHVRTAFISWHLARASGFSFARSRKTLLAALLHDIGGLSEELRLLPLDYYDNELNNHAAIGAELLASVPLLRPLSRIVHFHHTRWDTGKGASVNGEYVPEESHVIWLADRIDVLIASFRRDALLSLRETIVEKILSGAPALYKPEYVAAFKKIASHEPFWLTMQSTDFAEYINQIPRTDNDAISLHNFRDIAAMLAFIIDGHSQQGVQYSLAVGRIAGYLAREMDLSPTQCLKVEISGLLHDLPSLAHSPGRNEYEVWEMLASVDAIQDIAGWCLTQKQVDAQSTRSVEVSILKASIALASLLQGVTLLSELNARVAESTAISPKITRLVQKHNEVLLKICQEAIAERRALVHRINRLDTE